MKFSSFFTFSTLPFILWASELPPASIASLTEDLSKTEELATQTNQNIDYQPFILSVWQQHELIAFGAHTLKDALMLLPGIDMMGNTNNNRTPVIRGSNPLAYGQTKLAIDGVIVNDRSADTYTGYLDFPIELIQRIEVVRGSGSFIEGVNGYSGTINVITYAKDENVEHNGAIFGSFGSDTARQGGFWYTKRAADWKLSTDLFYQKNDAISPISVTDKNHNTGYAPLGSEQMGLGLAFSYDAFYLKGRFNRFKTGSAFGNLNVLPNIDGTQTFPSWYLESGYTFPLTSVLHIDAKAGIMKDGWKEDARLLPSGTYAGVTYPEGFWSYLNFETRLLYASIAAHYTGLKNNNLSIGYQQKYEDIINMSTITTDRAGGTNLVNYTNSLPFIDAGSACRHSDEIYLNDTIDLSDQLALSLNLGGTKASNLNIEPYARAAMVFQPYHEHIFKFMAGNSYRLPSFRELYSINNPQQVGNPDLEAEHVISYETQYLYKPSIDTTLGINLFYLSNRDQITPNTTNKMYQNIGKRVIKGFETEYRGTLADDTLAFLSYSYIQGSTVKGTETTDYLPYASSHLLKGGISYTLTPEWTAGIVGHYYSEKERRPNDARKEAMDSFASYDLILGWKEHRGFYVQGAIKDVNNAIYRYISPPGTYPDDYPIEGRTFWVRAGWEF